MSCFTFVDLMWTQIQESYSAQSYVVVNNQ